MKKFIAFMLTFMLAFAFLGCGDDEKDILPTKITLNSEKTTLTVDEQITITIKIDPVDVTNKEVEWTSSKPDVVEVTASKSRVTITAKSVGEAVITAKSKVADIKGEITITVEEAKVVAPTALAITNNNITLAPQNSAKLELVWTPTDVTNKNVDYTSSDEAIATVSATGVVTAVAIGEAIITVTSKADAQITATANVVVSEEEPIVLVEGIEITGTAECYWNFTQKLKAVISNTEATNKTVTWSVDDATIAAIDAATGDLKPLKDGTVKVTATANDGSGKSAEFTVVIKPMVAPTVYEVSVGNDTPKIGIQTQIYIKVGEENEDPKSTYTSSDEAIATVDENGKVDCLAIGKVTITCTSVYDPSKTGTVEININDGVEQTKPEKISIIGESEMTIGYDIVLSAVVLPSTATQSVVWESISPNVATISQSGTVTAIAEGNARFRCYSTVDNKIRSALHTVTVKPYVAPVAVDLKGYEILIMNADSALTDNDPFLEKYQQVDKAYKQQAWRAVESKYNCTIKVIAYPADAPWGATRIKWIKDNATGGTSQCDLGVVSSNWIPDFAKNKAAVDVTKFYATYGQYQMEPGQKEAGSFKNKIYIASTGISPTSTFVDLGLFYDQAWVEKLGVKDPATMFNEGEWIYSKFEAWVRDVQSKLDAEKFAIGGHPYYWWYGMTNAAGQKILDTTASKIYLSTQKSKDAAALYWKLYEEECVDPVVSWAETDGGFVSRTTVMTTGCLWFVRNTGRWTEKMFGEDTRYGYVPFPYPDTLSKEDTRIGVSGLSVMMYLEGRQYPEGVTVENIYQAVNEMFLDTIVRQKADSLFDPVLQVTTALSSRIDNPESIEAIRFFTAEKTFFDPAHAIYSSTAGTPIKTPCIDIMTKGVQYDQAMDAVYSQYENDFLLVFS